MVSRRGTLPYDIVELLCQIAKLWAIRNPRWDDMRLWDGTGLLLLGGIWIDAQTAVSICFFFQT